MDDVEEAAASGKLPTPYRLPCPANDNDPPRNVSCFSRQARVTPFLHAAGVGAFPSDDLPKFIDYYLLPGGKLPKDGTIIHLTDDNGDDIWAAVIPEYDPSVGEPWGVETYTTKARAEAALQRGLEEAPWLQ